jgi:hypothetical protein
MNSLDVPVWMHGRGETDNDRTDDGCGAPCTRITALNVESRSDSATLIGRGAP